MKKVIISSSAVAFILLLFWIGCQNNAPRRSSYVLLSQLAFSASLSHSNPDTSSLRQLFNAMQQESYELKLLNKDDVMQVRMIDLCPCPKALEQRLCPCPGDSLAMTRMIAPPNAISQILFDSAILEPSPADGAINGWKTYAWPGQVPDGMHTLKIKGDFTGNGISNYTLDIEVKNSKFYMAWPQ